jgi:hypothetical protein
MAEDIVIDKAVFFDHLSTFYNAWKADKRTGAGVFGGVGSIVILMGKTDEANSFQKANSIHVRDHSSPVAVCLNMPLTFLFPLLVLAPRL